MTKELLREVAEVNEGKRYLLLGSDGKDKNIIMDMSSTVVTVLPRQAVYLLGDKVANMTMNPKGVLEATDISTSRLGVIAEGGVSNFTYIIKRYKGANEEAIGYLMYKFTNYTQVQLLKLPTVDALKAFEYGMVLNAKKVTSNGAEIISGIQHNIPEESLFTKDSNVTKTGIDENAHTNYLDKLEKKFERSIVSRGFAVKPTATKDGVKAIKRFVEERIKTKAPDIYEWFGKMPSMRRGLQAIDLYTASNLQRRGTKDLNVYKSATFAYTSIKHIDFNALKNSCLVVVIDKGNKSFNFPPLNLDYLNQDTVVVQANKFGVISPSNLLDLKQLSETEGNEICRSVSCMVLNGTLMSDYDNLPVDKEIKHFFKTRDNDILDYLSINVQNFTKLKEDNEQEDYKLNCNLITGLRHTAVPIFRKVKKEDIDGAPTGSENYLFNVDSVDWSSDDAFIAMGYKPLDVSNVNLTGTIPLNRFYGTITSDNWNSKTTNSLVLLENQSIQADLITCVGDLILTYNFLFSTTSPTRDYEVDDEVLIKYLALLTMGNKKLAKHLASVNEFSDQQISINSEKIDSVEDYTGSIYKTGGRLGDKDIYNFDGVIPFFSNGRLSEEFQSKLATAISVLTEEPLERVKAIYHLESIYYTN